MSQPIFARIDDFRIKASRKRQLIGLSLTRIGFGLILLCFYLQNIPQRQLLWGPDGVFPIEFVEEIKQWYGFIHLFGYIESPALFDLFYFLAICVCVMYVVGYQTRVCGVLVFVFYWSITHRTPFVGNGGDNILYLLLFYLMFCDVGAYFSVDSQLKRKKGKDPLISNTFAGVVHNFGLWAAIAQFMTLYLFSFLYKVQGEKWMDGTALYYLMQVDMYSLPVVSEWIYTQPLLFVTGTYFALIFQYCFPFMIWFKKTKWLVVCMAVFFHGSIGILMGIPMFSLVMITADLMFFTDEEYHRAAAILKRRWGKNRIKQVIEEQPGA